MGVPTSHLANERLLDLLAHAESPVNVSDLLNRVPLNAFRPSDWSVAGLVGAVRRTQGAYQASVLQAFLTRGPAVFSALDVSRHLVLAQQVGQRGDSESLTALERAWAVAGLAIPVQNSLKGWVGRHALLRRHDPIWSSAQRWDSERTRPDKLRLSLQDACIPSEFDWGWQFLDQTSWTGRVDTAWAVLGRGWSTQPGQSTVESPALAIEVAETLLGDLPWGDAHVTESLSVCFSHSSSPFIKVIEHDYLFDPHLRLEALEGCVRLAERLEGRGVRLACGSSTLGKAWEAQSGRIQRAMG